MNKFTSVILLLLCINASYSAFLRQDQASTISPEIIDDLVNKLDSALNKNSMSGQIQVLEDKLGGMVNQIQDFQASLATIKTKEANVEQTFNESKEKMTSMLRKQEVQEMGAETKFSEAREPVEAQEIVQDPNAKVQLDGTLDFSFNVPISKYSSETSEIVQRKGAAPAKPQPQAKQVPKQVQQTQGPRQVIQRQQAQTQQYRPQQQQMNLQQQMAAQQQMQQQQLQAQQQQMNAYAYPQQQMYESGGWALNNQFIPQQEYEANYPQQQEMMMNNDMNYQQEWSDIESSFLQKSEGVDLSQTQWVGSDAYVQKAKADQDLRLLTEKELRNGAGNSMAYKQPDHYDIDTKTPQITTMNIDMF